MKKFFSFLALLIAIMTVHTASAQFEETVYDIPVNDLTYNSVDGLVYASVPGSFGPAGNSIMVFDPMTQSVVDTIPMILGSNPDDIDLTTDGKYLWVCLSGSGHILRIRLLDGLTELYFSLGPNLDGELMFPESISAMPDSNHLVAVSMMRPGVSPRYEGVRIYNTSGDLPEMEDSHTGLNNLTFGSDPETLWGYNNESSGFELFRCEIESDGVGDVDEYSGYISGYGEEILYHNDRLYSTRGDIIDISTGSPVMLANLDLDYSGAITVDSVANLIVYAYDEVDVDGIVRLDYNTFTFYDTIMVTTATDEVHDLVNCGPDMYALTTDDDQLIFIYPDNLGLGMEDALGLSLNLYPNPASNYFEISGLDLLNYQVQIFDINGSLVKSFSDAKSQFDISELPKGSYLVQINTQDSFTVKKIIKK